MSECGEGGGVRAWPFCTVRYKLNKFEHNWGGGAAEPCIEEGGGGQD